MSIRFKSIFLILIITGIALLSLNCEKDDICDPSTPVTPRLVIKFFSVDDNLPKNVTRLGIVSDNFPAADTVFNGVGEIKLALNPSSDEVEYKLILNIDNANQDIIYTDIIKFNYSRKVEYVSRACGYKTVYDLNNSVDLPPPFLLNNLFPIVQGNWIKNILIENYSITSENETHVKIYY